ncbi:hypothetical protein CDL12_16354 [Handroanthus impetiginosus]|uniref:Uncharacterized protein n=1 Tax=Handroanthus impetiginosus TaxID=429701 RepID=A0A2G9H0M8_9LAMI|nr:hypothetical protein CDL12_16354 [Handroanthus impetiginosus]
MDTQTIVKTPLHYASSTQNNSTFQDLSFSSYLEPKDPTPNSQETDTEISIFDAHKYFNETNDPKYIKRQETSHDSLSVPRLSSVSSVNGYRKNFWKESLQGTPKTSSEVSWAWNSQTSLLSNPLRNLRSNIRISAVKKWFFGRKCCCSGKKSVQVEEIHAKSEQRKPVVLINNEKINGSTKANYLHTNRDHIMEIHKSKVSLLPQDISTFYQSSQCRISASGRPFIDGPVGFTFPILSSSDKGIIAKPIIKPLEDPMDHPIAKPICKPLRDPSMDNPDNLVSPFDPGSPVACDDEVGSDASSDLFEIESFSNHTTLYRRRESLGEEPACNANGINNDNIQCGVRSLDEPPPPPSFAATECHTSSEVISSSEIGEADFLIRQRAKKARDDGGKRKPADNTVVSMSCRQEKVVDLGPQPVKCVAEGPTMFPLHVGGRPQRADKPPLGSASQSTATR